MSLASGVWLNLYKGKEIIGRFGNILSGYGHTELLTTLDIWQEQLMGIGARHKRYRSYFKYKFAHRDELIHSSILKPDAESFMM